MSHNSCLQAPLQDAGAGFDHLAHLLTDGLATTQAILQLQVDSAQASTAQAPMPALPGLSVSTQQDFDIPRAFQPVGADAAAQTMLEAQGMSDAAMQAGSALAAVQPPAVQVSLARQNAATQVEHMQQASSAVQHSPAPAPSHAFTLGSAELQASQAAELASARQAMQLMVQLLQDPEPQLASVSAQASAHAEPFVQQHDRPPVQLGRSSVQQSGIQVTAVAQPAEASMQAEVQIARPATGQTPQTAVPSAMQACPLVRTQPSSIAHAFCFIIY